MSDVKTVVGAIMHHNEKATFYSNVLLMLGRCQSTIQIGNGYELHTIEETDEETHNELKEIKDDLTACIEKILARHDNEMMLNHDKLMLKGVGESEQ